MSTETNARTRRFTVLVMGFPGGNRARGYAMLQTSRAWMAEIHLPLAVFDARDTLMPPPANLPTNLPTDRFGMPLWLTQSACRAGVARLDWASVSWCALVEHDRESWDEVSVSADPGSALAEGVWITADTRIRVIQHALARRAICPRCFGEVPWQAYGPEYSSESDLDAFCSAECAQAQSLQRSLR